VRNKAKTAPSATNRRLVIDVVPFAGEFSPMTVCRL
jgi:hypothetical protein